MKAIIELGDFQILDKWSKSPYMYKFVEAKEESENYSAYEMMSSNATKTLIVEYVSNEDFKTCPYHLTVKIEKPLYITALFPLINELQRTMNASFED